MLDSEAMLARMTLEQKAAQMVMAGFSGLSAPNEMLDLIRRGLGSAVLFAANIASPEQVATLTQQLQSAAMETQGLPLLIAADQEGGIVVRLTQGVSVFPGNMALGAADSEDLAYRAAYTTGRELAALGINMNLAPVVDVNNNPANPVIGVRSLGENPTKVAALGSAQVRGYQDGGVAATAKHFPGHGDTSLDSHYALPLVPHLMERLEAVELLPFRAAISADVAAIMTAHVVFPAIEPDLSCPATLSQTVLTGLLRQRLGYQGIIITDSMGMKAISDHFSPSEAAVRAVLAGADILAVAHGLRLQQESITGLVAAVQSGRISETRLDASIRRILSLKERYTSTSTKPVYVDADSTTITPLEVARRAVTILVNRNALPLSGGPWLLVEPGELAHTGEAGSSPTPSLAEFLAPALSGLVAERVPIAPSDQDIQRIVQKASICHGIIVVTRYATRQHAQATLAQALANTGHPVVVAALPNPYDAAVCPGAAAVVTAYDVHRAAVQATCEVLLGQLQATGKLPVTLA